MAIFNVLLDCQSKVFLFEKKDKDFYGLFPKK